MDINKFNNALLYSNKNVEKLARKLINESANATLMEMFDDKCILADHITGQIFEARYSFDGETFTFDNFDEISLEKTNDSLKEALENYFNDDNFNLIEAYENSLTNNSDVFENSLTEALAGKNMDNVINYSELEGINKELGDFKKSNVFKVYTERLEAKPTSSIKFFSWNKPVKVSLIDEDYNTILNKTMKSKAKKLRSNSSFKNSLSEAATDALSGDYSLLENVLEENTSVVALDRAELKELVGFSVVGNKTLMENRNKIADIIENIIENNEELSEKKTLFEEESEADESSKDDVPEATDEDIDSVKKALETAKSKAKDKKLIDKIDEIIASLDETSNAGETDVGSLKEAISILSL